MNVPVSFLAAISLKPNCLIATFANRLACPTASPKATSTTFCHSWRSEAALSAVFPKEESAATNAPILIALKALLMLPAAPVKAADILLPVLVLALSRTFNWLFTLFNDFSRAAVSA
jgi:hypothetical protein